MCRTEVGFEAGGRRPHCHELQAIPTTGVIEFRRAPLSQHPQHPLHHQQLSARWCPDVDK